MLQDALALVSQLMCCSALDANQHLEYWPEVRWREVVYPNHNPEHPIWMWHECMVCGVS
jgi:hypothetical protein